MDEAQIKSLILLLDGSGSDKEHAAIESLSQLGSDLPCKLLERYRTAKLWGQRASCVYHSIKYAGYSDCSYQLGIEALCDKSKHVRYRACMLLAVAQTSLAIPHLEQLLSDRVSAEDAEAAINSILCKNHNLFVDRENSGKVTLKI